MVLVIATAGLVYELAIAGAGILPD